MEHYEKLKFVGRGAHGTAYLARRKDDELVVLKEICVDRMSEKEQQQMLTEAKVLAMLDHPNVIRYYDSFIKDDETIVIAMEYASGGNLSQYLQQKPSDVYLEEEEVLNLFAQILLGLHHVHSLEILHRDLKPQNILMNKEQNVVKLGDFGISKILAGKTRVTSLTKGIGTPCYISPESWEAQPYNYASDIWALGCVLYELMMKKPAFEGETMPLLMLNISQGKMNPILGTHYSQGLKQLLEEMLQRDPNERPTTLHLMAHPILINPVFNLRTDIGAEPYESRQSTVSLPPLDLKSHKFFKFFNVKK